MDQSFVSSVVISNDELLEVTANLAETERLATLAVLRHLAEIERRRAFVKLGYSSLWEFALKKLKYSESAAYQRISVMHALQSNPELEDRIQMGVLSVFIVSQIQNVLKSERVHAFRTYSQEERAALFKRCEGKSSKDVTRELAQFSPLALKVQKERVITENRTEISFIADPLLLSKLKRVRDLGAARLRTPSSYPELMSLMSEVTLAKLDPLNQAVRAPRLRKQGAPRRTTKASSRSISPTLRTQIWKEFGGRCGFVTAETNARCEVTFGLEIEHCQPYSMGGSSNNITNLKLLCRQHNQWQAIQSYGLTKMEPYLNSSASKSPSPKKGADKAQQDLFFSSCPPISVRMTCGKKFRLPEILNSRRLGYFIVRVLTVCFSVIPFAVAAEPDLYLNGKNLANKLTEVILSQGHPADLTTQDIPDFRRKLYTGAPFSKYNSPDRTKLLKWILSQPDDSIGMEDFFLKSLELGGGNVQRGLMLGWDVLREQYPQAESRNLFSHTLKLRDITGERDLFDGQLHERTQQSKLGKPETVPIKTVRGDNFSAWYHFYGTALASFMGTAANKRVSFGKTETNMMILMEEKILHDEHIDSLKRVKIDRAGSDFGARLATNLKKYHNFNDFRNAPEAKETTYLYAAPEIYGEKWALKEGQQPADYGTDIHSFRRLPLLQRFREAKASLNPLKPRIGQQGLPPDELIPFMQDPNLEIRAMAQPWFDSYSLTDRVRLSIAVLHKIYEPSDSSLLVQGIKNEIYARSFLMKTDQARPIFEYLLQDLRADDNERARAASWLLSHSTPSDSLLKLAQIALTDPSYRVRAEGVRILRAIFTSKTEPLPYDLLDKALNAEKISYLREDAANILRPLRDGASLDLIEKTLRENRHPDLDKTLVNMLETRMKEDAAPRIEAMLESHFKRLASQRAAAKNPVNKIKSCLGTMVQWIQGMK